MNLLLLNQEKDTPEWKIDFLKSLIENGNVSVSEKQGCILKDIIDRTDGFVYTRILLMMIDNSKEQFKVANYNKYYNQMYQVKLMVESKTDETIIMNYINDNVDSYYYKYAIQQYEKLLKDNS